MDTGVSFAFKPAYMIGFEGEFNTIRLGLKYARELNPGDRVSLVYAGKGKRAGEVAHTATVTRIESGPKDRIIEDHARHNHVVVGRRMEGDLGAGMERILRAAYGNLFFGGYKTATAVYMRLTE